MFNDSRCLVTCTNLRASLDIVLEHALWKPGYCLSPMQTLAWPDLAQLLRCGVSQHRVMQLQAVKTWGFAELAAYQHSSLMHEGEQVTYSKYCTEPFLVHALGTRKYYLLLKAACLYASVLLFNSISDTFLEAPLYWLTSSKAQYKKIYEMCCSRQASKVDDLMVSLSLNILSLCT